MWPWLAPFGGSSQVGVDGRDSRGCNLGRCAWGAAPRRFPPSRARGLTRKAFIHSRPSLYPPVPPNYNILTMLLPLLGAGPR